MMTAPTIRNGIVSDGPPGRASAGVEAAAPVAVRAARDVGAPVAPADA